MFTRNLDALDRGVFDLVVLGGGITGAGVALDATLRGYRVAVVDRGDFAAGTSSASSKLVHGGLRYLERAEVGLVREALRERALLLRNAPHLVQPLRFVLPFYLNMRRPPWQWRLGLTLYDLLAGRGNLRRSMPLSAAQLRREFPQLRDRDLLGGAEYCDARMDDARLCLEVVRSAAGVGAVAVNYVEAVGFEFSGGRVVGVHLSDRAAGRALTVRARQVLNATGPWVDRVRQLAGADDGPRLQPTKGVHVLLPDRGFAAAFLLLHPADGRVFFVIPWLGRTLLGTTDTLCDEAPEALTVTAADVAYLLEGYNHFFQTPCAEGDVISRFAGLRPLLRAGTAEPSALSREFRVIAGPPGLLSVAGGKYTTYRHTAQVVTDELARRLGRRGWGQTQYYPLAGTPAGAWPTYLERKSTEFSRRLGLSLTAAAHLVGRYGRCVEDVVAYLLEPGGLEPVAAGEPELCGELTYQRAHEMALYPADHLLRRTRLGLVRPELLGAAPGAEEAPGSAFDLIIPD
jgi:glycerol-3-phosphate dehydrogenase